MEERGIIRNLVPRRVRKFLKDRLGITALQGRITALEERVDTDILALQRRVERLEDDVSDLRGVPAEVTLAHGLFGAVERRENTLNVSGWMLLPERGFDSVALYINGRKAGECSTMESGGVVEMYPFISHARNSGFHFRVQTTDMSSEELTDVCVVGISRGRERARMETWYRADLYSSLPVPPGHLMVRENRVDSPSYHVITGAKCYREFLTTAHAYAAPHSIKRMLDWGCGCGRIVGFFSKFSGIPRVCGCDVDAEAVAWCSENLKPAEFSAIPLRPPTSYAGQSFDLIISFSVLTHLSKDLQSAWLEEMQRILAPGGLFLATVHGEFAAAFRFPGRTARDILRDGIYDGVDCGTLDGIVPEGYYRAVFQTREYTMREYSRYFEVLEYREAGGLNFQDMVVMRKRS
jgi:SAM-dependent methyltransferase